MVVTGAGAGKQETIPDLWAAVRHRSKKKKTLESGRKSPLPAVPLQCFLLTKFTILPADRAKISVSPAPVSQSWGKGG